jgi:hypothetical protein
MHERQGPFSIARLRTSVSAHAEAAAEAMFAFDSAMSRCWLKPLLPMHALPLLPILPGPWHFPEGHGPAHMLAGLLALQGGGWTTVI